ncbi:MAG: phosphoribosyltransferase family protein [Brevinematia bacterium]
MKLLVNCFCYNCGKEVEYRNILIGLCGNCAREIQRIDITRSCKKCGLPYGNENCTFCKENVVEFDKNVSLYEYQGIIKYLIQCIKFENDISKIKVIKQLTKDIVLDEIFGDFIDLVVPVPPSLLSFLNRGFDLVEMIFKPISILNRKPFVKLLSKKPLSKQQKKLSKEERMNIIRKSFYIKMNIDLNNKVILLCDDIFTTGNTLNACASLIKKLNPKKVYTLTLARSIRTI